MRYCLLLICVSWLFSCEEKPQPPKIAESNPGTGTAQPPVKINWKQLSGWELPVSLATDILEEEIPAVNAAMPASLKDLDGKRVRIAGFMMPCSNQEDLVDMFLLVPDQMACCSGRSPASHEVIAIRPSPPVPYIKDVPCEVVGIFSAETRLTPLGTGSCNLPWRLTLESLRPAPECAAELPNPDPNYVPPADWSPRVPFPSTSPKTPSPEEKKKLENK
ncbi:MAG: hypothetical protein RL095_3541 [Verrucomicrobiota bacterium]|jgi:hypothetical protein